MDSKIVDLYHFVGECGYFTSDTELNGGYGCTYNEKEKEEPGCCYKWDCPFASEPDIEDFKKLDQHLYNEYKDNPDGIESSDWMLQHTEVGGYEE